ncbi:hypothetical protein AAC387_Pa08g0038 [Persea americana]
MLNDVMLLSDNGIDEKWRIAYKMGYFAKSGCSLLRHMEMGLRKGRALLFISCENKTSFSDVTVGSAPEVKELKQEESKLSWS